MIKKIQSLLEVQGAYTITHKKEHKRSTNLYLQEGPVVEIYNTETVVVRGKGNKQAVKNLLGLTGKIKKVPNEVFDQFELAQAEVVIALPCATNMQVRKVERFGRQLGLVPVRLDKELLAQFAR